MGIVVLETMLLTDGMDLLTGAVITSAIIIMLQTITIVSIVTVTTMVKGEGVLVIQDMDQEDRVELQVIKLLIRHQLAELHLARDMKEQQEIIQGNTIPDLQQDL